MNPHYRAQRLLFAIATLIAVALLYVAFQHWFGVQRNPNQYPNTISHNGIATITLKPNNSHTYVVNGMVNHQPVTFIIDTGASRVAVSDQLAKKLSLRRGMAMQMATANGTITGYATRIKRIQISQITLHNISGVINPGMHGNTVLLGNSALKYLKITYHNQRMILQQGTL